MFGMNFFYLNDPEHLLFCSDLFFQLENESQANGRFNQTCFFSM